MINVVIKTKAEDTAFVIGALSDSLSRKYKVTLEGDFGWLTVENLDWDQHTVLINKTHEINEVISYNVVD